MQPKHPLLQKCIAQLESLPNLSVRANVNIEPFITDNFLADGQLTLISAGGSVDYICEIKSGLTIDVVEKVVQYFNHLKRRLGDRQRPLLVTQRLSNIVIDQLLLEAIEFVDVEGNLYLNSPTAYVLVRSQSKRESAAKPIELTVTSLQVIYAILKISPAVLRLIKETMMTFQVDEPWYVAALSHLSGIKSGSVKSTLDRLKTLGYITYRQGDLKVTDPTKLLERWEMGYVERLRPRSMIGVFRSIDIDNFSALGAKILSSAKSHQYLIGGELGAAIITDQLRPSGATLYLKENNYRQFVLDLRLRPDINGNITLLRSFDESKPSAILRFARQRIAIKYKDIDLSETESLRAHLANPLLIHAELMRSDDDRLKETARIIYGRYIEEKIDTFHD